MLSEHASETEPQNKLERILHFSSRATDVVKNRLWIFTSVFCFWVLFSFSVCFQETESVNQSKNQCSGVRNCTAGGQSPRFTILHLKFCLKKQMPRAVICQSWQKYLESTSLTAFRCSVTKISIANIQWLLGFTVNEYTAPWHVPWMMQGEQVRQIS